MNQKRSLRASIVRKLGILDDINSNGGETSKAPPAVHRQSLTYRFLKGYPELVGMVGRGAIGVSSDIEVRVLADAIEYAYAEGSEAGLSYIKYFEGIQGVDVKLLSRIIDENGTKFQTNDHQINRIDRSLFCLSEMSEDARSVRQCYAKALGKHQIDLPFSKQPMDRLLELVKFPKRKGKIKNLEDLRLFSVEFFTTLWPLFSPRVLSIIFRYFQYKFPIAKDDMDYDWTVLSMFGFERLLSRLILLRAINGDEVSRKFIDEIDIWYAAGFGAVTQECVIRFLEGQPSEFHELDSITDDNPIENAIILSIFVLERTDEVDFASRLLKAYDQDPSISLVLNWDAVYDDIRNIRHLRKPELIFLAALVTQPDVMTSSMKIAGQYGRGGAGLDLQRFARYHRDKLQGTRSSFLTSFDGLPKSAIELIVYFLFSSSMLDRISNEFPSNTSTSGSLVPSSPAVRSLEARDELINYARKRKILPQSYAKYLLDDVRDKYRQIRFESNEDGGRIRIRKSELAAEISTWLRSRINVVALPKARKNATYFERRLEARASLLSPALADFLCFASKNKRSRNRFAFNNLLADKLRHNFLSIRIAEKLQPVFEEYDIDSRTSADVSEAVESNVKTFSDKWLTIYNNRSFFAVLVQEMAELIVDTSTAERSKDDVIEELSHRISNLAIESFDKLLESCRGSWTEVYLEDSKSEVREVSEELKLPELVVDRLVEALEQGFSESSHWMRVNQDAKPNGVKLRDLLLSETFLLKKQPSFRDNFRIELFQFTEQFGRQTTEQELALGGEFLTPLVSIVDNLIPNACKSSHLGASTPIRIRCFLQNNTLSIEVSNKIDISKTKEILHNIEKAKTLLERPIEQDVLGASGGGTGIFRIRNACEEEFGERFQMNIAFESSAEFPVTVTCLMPCDNWKWC